MQRKLIVRNVLQAIFLACWSVIWVSLSFVVAAVTFSRDIPLVLARTCWAPPLIWATETNFLIELAPEIDWKKPYVLVMNHQSMLDIPCAFAGLPTNIRFMAKQILKYVPFVGWFMWMTGMVFVDRAHRSKAVKSLKEAKQKVARGQSLLFFPEGTRSRDGRVLPFKRGPFALALELGVPVVPIAIDGSLKVLPPGGFAIRPGTVRMKAGKPISTRPQTPLTRDQLATQVRDEVVRLHREIGGLGEAPSRVRAPALEPS